MKRREALQTLSLGMGYTLTASGVATLLQACRTEAKATWTPVFFNPTEARIVEELLDIMLPPTDTPGAKELGVAPLADLILKDVYKPKDQEVFRQGMHVFLGKIGDEAAQKKVDREQLTNLLKQHTTALSAPEQKAIGELLDREDPPAEAGQKEKYYLYSFFKTLRSLGISGYFTSEVIATQHLNYAPVPGPYQGCIPASEVGTTWAL